MFNKLWVYYKEKILKKLAKTKLQFSSYPVLMVLGWISCKILSFFTEVPFDVTFPVNGFADSSEELPSSDDSSSDEEAEATAVREQRAAVLRQTLSSLVWILDPDNFEPFFLFLTDPSDSQENCFLFVEQFFHFMIRLMVQVEDLQQQGVVFTAEEMAVYEFLQGLSSSWHKKTVLQVFVSLVTACGRNLPKNWNTAMPGPLLSSTGRRQRLVIEGRLWDWDPLSDGQFLDQLDVGDGEALLDMVEAWETGGGVELPPTPIQTNPDPKRVMSEVSSPNSDQGDNEESPGKKPVKINEEDLEHKATTARRSLFVSPRKLVKINQELPTGRRSLSALEYLEEFPPGTEQKGESSGLGAQAASSSRSQSSIHEKIIETLYGIQRGKRARTSFPGRIANSSSDEDSENEN
jgi:hypothetical protein